MVGEHCCQQRLVGQQRFLGHAQFGQQCSKCRVGGCEHGERARAQRGRQAGGDHGFDQDAQLGGVLCQLDDVALGFVVSAPTSLQQGGAGAQGGCHQDGPATEYVVHGDFSS
ncbi:hypothetical protein D3C71_1580940 [compost metagenome]